MFLSIAAINYCLNKQKNQKNKLLLIKNFTLRELKKEKTILNNSEKQVYREIHKVNSEQKCVKQAPAMQQTNCSFITKNFAFFLIKTTNIQTLQLQTKIEKHKNK